MLRSGLVPPLWQTGVLLGLFVVAAFAPSVARADDADEARSRQAQALFERGRDTMAAGDVERACALFAESQHLDPGGGTLLNLAVCHEKQGRLATAWTEFHEALSTSIRDDRKDRQALASERIRAIEARLPHLVVTLPRVLPEGFELRVDGAPLSRLAAGAPLPINPGPHEFVATAPGYPTWSAKLDAVAESQNVLVEVPAFELRPATTAPLVLPRTRLSTGSFVAGGIAIAGYTTMAITGALALTALSSANKECDPGRDFCSPAGQSDGARARTMAWVSTVSLGAALAATAVAVLWPRSRAGERPASEVQFHDIAPEIGLASAGLRASF